MRKFIYTILALVVLSTTAQALKINEVLAANTHTNLDSKYKQFSNWVELYNESSSSINIGGYYLSDDLDTPTKWKIPSGTRISGEGYLLIWADGEDSGLHTNFKLKTSGEAVVLSDSSANLVDIIQYPAQKSDISFAKVDDNIVYMEPTPNRANSQTYQELTRSKKPSFLLDSGFYSGTQTLELTQENEDIIYYTTDGSIPTKNSNQYTQPITISKTTMIRARSLEDGKFLSAIKNRTYLIDEDITLPVVSIGIDDVYLYDDEIGIYTKGNHINFRQDWMRPASIEYIKDGESKFSENIGVRVYGGGSRIYAQKSLAIFAKDRYGAKSINYKLFPDKPFIKKVKSFVLRNGGNEWERTMIKDGMIHNLIKDNMDIDCLSYHPTVMFLNGEYWGIHNIREKPNGDYIEANHGIDADNIDMLKNPMRAISVVTDGDSQAYTDLLEFVKDNDLSIQANYEQAIEQIDLNEYLNYISTQIYIGNNDWPGNNIKYWKEHNNNKWRWILFDTDYSFTGYRHNSIFAALDKNSASLDNPPWSTLLLRNLMENDEFKNKFVGKFTSHLYTTFDEDRINSYITQHKNEIAPYIQRHYEKWGQKNFTEWEKQINYLYKFANRRPSYIMDFISDRLNVTGNNNLTIQTVQDGTIYLDGIKLDNTFNGNYFNNAKVTLTAKADEGYKFVRWSDGQTEESIEVTLNSNIGIEAIFEEKIQEQLPKIIITEINYKSADYFNTGDWIELYNNDTQDVDISGWILKDKKDDQPYTIPNGTILKKETYIVFGENETGFKILFPNVTNIIGDFTFGLGKNEDSVRLFNTDETLINSVSYDREWADAKGNGKTLTLIDVNNDNTQAQNWEASELHGTPGSNQTNQTRTIKLEQNWNLIGVNANLTLEELKGKLGADNILVIQGGGEVYKKENDLFLNDFTEFKLGEGYWIKLESQTSLEYTPITYTDKTIQLTSGWNLINPMSNLTLAEIKTQISDTNLEVIQGGGKVYKKDNSDFLNSFKKLEEPLGYWIKIVNDRELTF